IRGAMAALWKKLRVGRRKPPELLPAAAFRRLVQSLVPPGSFGVQGAAVGGLREGCKAHLVALLEVWGLCALHAKRAAPRAADVQLVRCLRAERR
ncbi:H3 protein, partial [Rhinopomastus cyanomelas]|nr:H3 protein [Rhinopomastus cyanomelas]